MSITLRPYQDAAVADFEHAVAAGQRRILLVAPTASGKTVVFCAIIRRYVEQYKTVLVISHRREIIQQTSDKLTANGIYHGIIQAGIARVQWRACKLPASQRCMSALCATTSCRCRRRTCW